MVDSISSYHHLMVRTTVDEGWYVSRSFERGGHLDGWQLGFPALHATHLANDSW